MPMSNAKVRQFHSQSYLYSSLMGRTHVRIKGQNLSFYLETHVTTHNIYFMGAAAYQLGNTSSRTITEVKQR